jgi:hypothetical protein
METSPNATLPPGYEGITFEKVWAILQEQAREADQRSREADQRSREADQRSREADRRLQETDRQIRKTEKLIEKNAIEMEALTKTVERVTKNVGGLNRSMGELIETLIAARLWEKFTGYNLARAYQRMPIFDEQNRVLTDIDILLSNTTVVMAVEVKHELNKTRDIDEHLKRMELIRKYPPAEVGGKKLLGALAGGVVDPDVRRYAWESGFFVLELSGESVDLVPPPEGFAPRQW